MPSAHIDSIEILVRADSAGATHELAGHCHESNIRVSFGYELTEAVRAAILEIPDDAWVSALDQDGSERENGEVCEISDHLDLRSWPDDCRVIVRRERPHPGAQLSVTDHDGYRFQAILTDQPGADIAIIERRHRQRARVEDRIRDDKDTGLAKLPFKAFPLNELWVEIVMLAHDLIVWTQALLLNGELSKADPNDCVTDTSTSPPGSRSPHARGSCTSLAAGRGPMRSRPRSRNSKRCPLRPADRHPGHYSPGAEPPASGHDHHCPEPGRTRPERSRVSAFTARRDADAIDPSSHVPLSHPRAYRTIGVRPRIS